MVLHETKTIFISAFPITWPKFQFSIKGITSKWSAGHTQKSLAL